MSKSLSVALIPRGMPRGIDDFNKRMDVLMPAVLDNHDYYTVVQMFGFFGDKTDEMIKNDIASLNRVQGVLVKWFTTSERGKIYRLYVVEDHNLDLQNAGKDSQKKRYLELISTSDKLWTSVIINVGSKEVHFISRGYFQEYFDMLDNASKKLVTSAVCLQCGKIMILDE
jgi:hypothetical protein